MRKGVSPIISSVILITITVMLGFIIFKSSSEFIAELSPPPNCEEVLFEAGIYLEENEIFLEANNLGSIQIDGFELIVSDSATGSDDPYIIKSVIGLGQSVSIIIDAPITINSIVKIIPRIINGENIVTTCPEELSQNILVK